MKRWLLLFTLLGPIASVVAPNVAHAEASAEEMVAMLATIDDRQRNSGDYHAVSYIETKQEGRSDLVYLADIYRRDENDKLVILFTRPQSEAGKGYLRIDDS